MKPFFQIISDVFLYEINEFISRFLFGKAFGIQIKGNLRTCELVLILLVVAFNAVFIAFLISRVLQICCLV